MFAVTQISEDCLTVCLQVFLSLGSNFTLQLVSVRLLSGPFYGIPTILQEAKNAILSVPEEAANSQVTGPGCSSQVNHKREALTGSSKVFKNFFIQNIFIYLFIFGISPHTLPISLTSQSFHIHLLAPVTLSSLHPPNNNKQAGVVLPLHSGALSKFHWPSS
jgi:hypothetical protein